MYGWKITKNKIDDGNNLFSGPRNISYDSLKALRDGQGEKFRLIDDDGEIYFYGRIVGDYNGFEPLDDLGTAYGCTVIEYKNKETGIWEML